MSQSISYDPGAHPARDRAAEQFRRWRELRAERAALRRRRRAIAAETAALQAEIGGFLRAQHEAPGFDQWRRLQRIQRRELHRFLRGPRPRKARGPASPKPFEPRPLTAIVKADAETAPRPGFCACGRPLPPPPPPARSAILRRLQTLLAANGIELGAESGYAHALVGNFLILKLDPRQRFAFERHQKMLENNGHRPLWFPELLIWALIRCLPELEKPCAREVFQYPLEQYDPDYSGFIPRAIALGP